MLTTHWARLREGGSSKEGMGLWGEGAGEGRLSCLSLVCGEARP